MAQNKNANRKLFTDDQFSKCQKIIHSASASAAAAGAIPLPFADSLIIAPIQIGMIIGLGAVFGEEITKSGAKELSRNNSSIFRFASGVTALRNRVNAV